MNYNSELAATTSKKQPPKVLPGSGKVQKGKTVKKVELTPKQKKHQQDLLRTVTEAFKRRFQKKK